MRTILLCALASFAAIAAGVVIQPLLVWTWPLLNKLSVGGVTAESYAPILVSAPLAFWVGYRLRRHNLGARSIWAAMVAPFLFLTFTIAAVARVPMGWHWLTLLVLLTGVVPVAAILVGWLMGARMVRLTTRSSGA